MQSQPPLPAIGFVCVIADEGIEQLRWFLDNFLAVYPGERLTVISDGAADPSYAPLCASVGVMYVHGKYLKRLECGGAWWRRTLEAGLALGTPYFAKIDPDTKVWRQLQGLPMVPDGVYGSLMSLTMAAHDYQYIQGGCQVFSRSAADKILRSPLLDSRSLRRRETYAENQADSKQIEALAYLSTDKSLAWLAPRIGIQFVDWSEIYSRWRDEPPENSCLTYAVTHPHKLDLPTGEPDAPLHVITTCKGRLSHLKQSLPTWVSEPGVTVSVVDYDCPDDTSAWVRKEHPGVRLVEARGLPRFNLAHARNIGAAKVPDGWLCFFDADWIGKPGWAESVRSVLKKNHYYLVKPINWDKFGSVVVHSDDYKRAGGYDELFRAWGSEDSDFYSRLRHCCVRPDSTDASYFTSIKHDDAMRTAHYDIKSRAFTSGFYTNYVRLKVKHMLDSGTIPTVGECRRFLYNAATSVSDESYGDSVPPSLVNPAPIPSYSVTIYEPQMPIQVVGVSPVNPVNAASNAGPRPPIVIVNRSSVVSDAEGRAWTAALQIQLDRDVAPLWYGRSASLAYIDKHTSPPLSAWHLYLLDDSDQAQALGYHDRTQTDLPFGNVFCRTTAQDGDTISVTVSHELLEMLMDPHCNMMVDASPDGSGSLMAAYEVADAPKDDRYAYAINGIAVSDFCTPAYFDPAETTGPFDCQGHISKPFEILPGGYLAFLVPGKGWTQKTADGDSHCSSSTNYLGNRWHRRLAGRARAGRNSGHAHRVDMGQRA